MLTTAVVTTGRLEILCGPRLQPRTDKGNQPGHWMATGPRCRFWTCSSTSTRMLLVSSRQECQIIINKTPAGTTQKALLIWVPLIGWIPCHTKEFCAGIGGAAVVHSPLFKNTCTSPLPSISRFVWANWMWLKQTASEIGSPISACCFCFPQTNNSLFIQGKPKEMALCRINILHKVAIELQPRACGSVNVNCSYHVFPQWLCTLGRGL